MKLIWSYTQRTEPMHCEIAIDPTNDRGNRFLRLAVVQNAFSFRQIGNYGG